MLRGSKNRSLVIIILTTGVLALLATGCGQRQNQPDTQTIKTTSTKKATKLPTPRSYTATPAVTKTPTPTPAPVSPLGVDTDDLKDTSVQFWHTWSDKSGEVLDQLVEEFNSQNEWGIRVQATTQGSLDEMYANVHAAINRKEAPDLVVGYLYQALDWDEEWELADLNEYVDDPVWGLRRAEQDDFYAAFWDHDQSGDRRIGIPAQRSGQLIYYNSTWAEELGFSELPSTPEQFGRQACTAARANLDDENPDNDGTGGWIISTNYSAILGWMYAFGAEVAPSPGSKSADRGYNFEVQAVEEALTFLRELYDDGCAWLPENQYPNEDFATRRGLFATDSVTGIPYQQAAFDQVGNPDRWTVIPFPSPTGEPTASIYGPSFEILSSTPEEQLAAWLFVKWLVSPQNQARLIEATNAYPLRVSILEQLPGNGNLPPQWMAAADGLPFARSEPALRSWHIVRWAVSDAATQLFRYYFTIQQVPELVAFLHRTANDLHKDPLKDSSIKSPTPTLTPTVHSTPSITATADDELVTPTP